MKTYKSLEHFKKRAIKRNGLEEINLWDDWGIKVGGKIYALISYGGGSLYHMDYDFIEFRNKRTGGTIFIKYDCPSYAGGKLIKPFRFISAEEY